MVTKKKALITGTSQGIGRAIAEKLLETGWKVFGLCRRAKKCALPHSHFCPIDVDLSCPRTLETRLKEIKKEIGSIDAIIANSGRGLFKHLEEFSFLEIQSLMQLNFFSHVYLIKTFFTEMKKKSFGDIIFIGSEAALRGNRKGSIYCASKFALRGFAQALRQECRNCSIRVCLINPGMVKTPFFDRLNFSPGNELEEHIEPKDIADAVSMVLHSRRGTVFDEINLSPQKTKILSTS